MENKYQNEGVGQLMEKYNFDSAIEVTLVIEEEEETEPVLLKDLLISNKTNGPNSNICSNISEAFKKTDSNIDKAQNKMPMAKKNHNNISVVEENNRSNSVIQTVLPEGLLEKTQDIQWQLLDNVADNLIHITKCYYHNFINTKEQMRDYEKVTLEYKNFKRYFFNLSYSTTIAILLPQENDKLFLNYFIHRVIEIANRNSWYHISYEKVESLIGEMLIWTKRKKQILDIKFGLHNHEKDGMDCSSSALPISNKFNSRQTLNRPFDNGPTTNHAMQETNGHPDIVPKTHLPVQVMNISPNIRHITNYSTQELTRPLNVSPTTSYLMQNMDNPNCSGHIKNIATPKRTIKWHNDCSETLHSQPEINISPYFIQRTNHSNQGTSSSFNIEPRINNKTQEINCIPYNDSRRNSTKPITSIYSNEPKTNNFSTCQATNTNSGKILLSTGPPNHEYRMSVDSEIFTNINHQNTNQLSNNECYVNEAYGTQSNKSRKTNESYYYPYSNSNSMLHIEETNRSISAIQTVLPEGLLKKNQDIQRHLLDNVADNLIHITKCYYHNFINTKEQMRDYEKVTLEYKNFKHYFFNLSYSTTIAILLPEENNIIFFYYFIHRVIKIANCNSWYQISYEIVESLIREMLIWTKQKKQSLDIKFGLHNHEKDGMDCSSSALPISNRFNSRQTLNRPFDNGPTTNHAMQETNGHPDIVPKTHLPVQVMNISPNIRHITNYSTQELTRPLNVSPRTNYLMQDIDNPNYSGDIKNIAPPKRTIKWHNNCSETFHSQPEINISPYFVQKTNHSNQGTSSSLNIEPTIINTTQEINCFPYNDSGINSTEPITSIYSNEPKTNNFSTCQATNTNSSKILLSIGPPNHEITISVDSEIYSNVNHQNKNLLKNNATECHVSEAYGTQLIKRRKTNDNSNSMPRANDNNFHYNKNNCSATTFKSSVDGPYQDDSTKAEHELFNTDTLRSSISRDSGFGSPICGSFRSEQTIETPTSEEQGTPMITYVTSMNPNAVPLHMGCCKVCGATTNHMCIGCYQKYYCSFLCQKKDWENHKYLCSR